MTEDEQSGTLAFLQNFYTGVTLYMPAVAAEPLVTNEPAAAAPAPALAALPPPTPAPVAVAPPPTVVLPIVPLPPAAPARLPASASVPLPPPAPPVAAAAPRPAPVSAPVQPPAVFAGPADAPAVAPYLLTTFDTLGANAAGVVLLVRLPPAQFVKLPRNVFLNKLLQAIGLVMADVVLVNVDGPYPVALANLRKEIAATTILAFGRNLLDVAVRTTQIYEPVQFPAVGLSYLAGAEVEMVEYDVSLKKRLWAGLQRMFPK
ncbi:hypothetical protein E4631_10075 [Hymenobacter sp. UV11]|uniref:hypothetical protein n=1 Tax=Hymenobacter sp. UV11 TaxID=1849735 RepID=UPI0010600EFD|nr:hypothetical protein [Hymenobacter sp. UV11]TDN36835.1 hypothetical protein A8B98_06660 [Hymenobacter sp. UV11]TFZ66361.1 hypothetical protein E4631_10075 [Hymenobacter sp. UV11]